MSSKPGMTVWGLYQERAAQIEAQAFRNIASRADWETERPTCYRQFMRSVGLDPLPGRCELEVTDHGEFRGPGYRARKVAFQILPDCWATAAIFHPDPAPKAASPAVLYLCGHWTSGIAGGQNHGALWARRGYVCLVLDTIEQHDNPGDHHGLWRQTRHDWLSLGYAASGGELWNSMRALDLLASLPEVDARRIGTTGNSGGGSLSFLLGIADTRIRAVASACGITVPRQTIRDRHVPDHCDCMYLHNVYRRDTSEFAALIAPRPLLYCFAAQDLLFSQEEYRGLMERTRRIYKLYGSEGHCDLCEYPGPHGYKPETIQAVQRWFDRHVAGEDRPAVALEEPQHDERTVTVFNGQHPATDRLDLLPELLTPVGSVPLPRTPQEWPALRAATVETLRREVFPHLARPNGSLDLIRMGEWLDGDTRASRYAGQVEGVDVWMELRVPPKGADQVVVGCAAPGEYAHEVMGRLGAAAGDAILIAVEPRGTGYTSCHPNPKGHLLRVGALVGLTPVTLIMEDLAHFLAFINDLHEVHGKPLHLYGRGDAGVACLYHAVLNEQVGGVVAEDIPGSHRQGGHILGILRVLDLQHTVGLLAPRPVALINMGPTHRMFWAGRLYQRLGCPEKLAVWSRSLRTSLRHVLTPPA